MQEDINNTDIIDRDKEQRERENKERGKRLRAIREAKGLSQEALAALFHKDPKSGQGYVSRLELGKHKISTTYRTVYISLLGANGAYIETGEGPMFSDPSKIKASPDQIYAAISDHHQRGNMRYIKPDRLGAFLRDSRAWNTFKFPITSEELFWFPVMEYEGGREYPYGSYVVCTYGSTASLAKNRPFIFQTDTGIFLRRYMGQTDKFIDVNYTSGLVADAIAMSEIKQIYMVLHRYVPAV